MLRRIDFEKEKSFEVKGRKFFLADSLSFARYKELQKLMLEFGYSATFVDIFNSMKLAWDDMNRLKLGEAAVRLHNMMNGITKIDDKDPVALRVCALFINEDGEDETEFNEAKMADKIKCWGEELDVLPFFHLAASLVPGWMPAYQLVLNDGLKETKDES